MTERLRVEPAAAPLSGEARVPGDKSIGHRAVLLGGLAEGVSRLAGLSGGHDNQRTVAALQALGAGVRRTGPGALEIAGRGLFGLQAPAAPLDCGNSGTSLRLLAGVLAAQPFPSVLDGDEYLRARPMRRVVEPLGLMGGRLRGEPGRKAGEVYPPLRIDPIGFIGPTGQAGPARPRGIRYASPIASAQVKSALLLCGLWAEEPTEVLEPARSRDHTERLLRHLGVPLVAEDGLEGARSRLDPAGWRRVLPPLSLVIPGDLSSAAFLLGAALLVPGSEVVVRGVGLNPTRTGVLDALAQLAPGAVEVLDARDEGGEPVGDLRARAPDGPLRPIAIAGDLALRALDELPLLGALAGAAEGESTIAGAAELRVKESDRIAATCALLRAFGVACEERPDGMVIAGRGRGALTGAQVESFGDHRIAMAGAVLALAAPASSLIADTENVATSFPSFAETLVRLGARIEAG